MALVTQMELSMDLATPWEESKGHGKPTAQQMDLAIPSDLPWAIEILMAEQMDLERWKEPPMDLERSRELLMDLERSMVRSMDHAIKKEHWMGLEILKVHEMGPEIP